MKVMVLRYKSDSLVSIPLPGFIVMKDYNRHCRYESIFYVSIPLPGFIVMKAGYQLWMDSL